MVVDRDLGAWAGPAAAVAAVAVAVWLVMVYGSIGWGFDFQSYMLAAERLGRGEPIYLAWMLTGPFRPGPFGLYLYAPPLAVVTLPLTALSSLAATDVWFILHAGLFVAACALMPVPRRTRLLVFAVGALSEPVLTDFLLGNVSLVIMFLAVIGWRWLDRPPGSVALAFAMSLRPTMGIFLAWWIVRRQWRPLAWAFCTGAVLIVASLPFTGTGAYADYLRMLLHLSDMAGVPNNVDLGSTALSLGAGPALAAALVAVGFGVAIGAVAVSLRRDRDVSYMVVFGATLLLSPLLWDHYLVDLLLPTAFLAGRGRTWALGLPLLAWLPGPIAPLLAVAATILPLIAVGDGAPVRGTPARDVYEAGAGVGSVPGALSNRTAPPA